MLTDRNHLNEKSEACYDLLRTSIAVDRGRVKALPSLESPTSSGVSPVESRESAGRQLRPESGERFARHAARTTGRDAPPTITGVVLSRPRQSRQEASHAGSGLLLRTLVAALVLAWWPEQQRELALALDATTLGQRFTVLCVSVLVRGCAIPVAWKVLAYNQKGSWQPYWQGLLTHLDGVIPADWTVLVLADRGLYARLSVSTDRGPGLASVPAHQCGSQSLCAGQRPLGMDRALAARLRTAVGRTGRLFCRPEDPPGLHVSAVPRTRVRGGMGRGHRPAPATGARRMVSLTRLD